MHGKDEIGVRVGKVVNKYKVGKHFKLDIQDDGFDFELDPGKVQPKPLSTVSMWCARASPSRS